MKTNSIIFKSQQIVVKPKVPVLRCQHAGKYVIETDTPVSQQEACKLYRLRATQLNQSRCLSTCSADPYIDCLHAQGPKVAASPTDPAPYIANVSIQSARVLAQYIPMKANGGKHRRLHVQQPAHTACHVWAPTRSPDAHAEGSKDPRGISTHTPARNMLMGDSITHVCCSKPDCAGI